jgi:HPr kinase/phosphorylase
MKEIRKKAKSITLKVLMEKLNFTSIENQFLDIEITTSEVYRTGYEFLGFFHNDRDKLDTSIHLVGEKEGKYLMSIPLEKRIDILENYFSLKFPCVVISSDTILPVDFFEIAKKKNKIVLKSKQKIGETVRILKFFLQNEFSEEVILKGYVFMEIYGMGVLIGGDDDSKFGSTIELLERGHKLITDDNVIVKKLDMEELIGSNRFNKNLKDSHFFLSNKNNTKIDITDNFGIKSTRAHKRIDLITELEKWDEKKFYDRLGLDTVSEKILEIEVPIITLPVRRGRNLAVIIETAAMNIRLKKMGINSAEYFWNETKKIIAINKERQGLSKEDNLKSMPVHSLVKKFNLEILSGSSFIEDKKITNIHTHRPSLPLSGYFEIYEEEGNNGIQIFSEFEFNFLETLPIEIRNANLDKFLSYNYPVIVITSNVQLPSYFLKKIEDHKQILCRSPFEKVSQIMALFSSHLEAFFAPSVSIHGVFLELYGFGVLLTGKSGVGKSETALELIHRGHRLVADDLVKFVRNPNQDIVGKAAKLPYFMEIRGLGIIDIKTLYGLGAIRITKRLDAIIELKDGNNETYSSSVSYVNSKIEVVGKDFDKSTLFISSGRNAAAMVEIAVMNLMAKKLGHDSEENFKEGMKRLTKEEMELLDYDKL